MHHNMKHSIIITITLTTWRNSSHSSKTTEKTGSSSQIKTLRQTMKTKQYVQFNTFTNHTQFQTREPQVQPLLELKTELIEVFFFLTFQRHLSNLLKSRNMEKMNETKGFAWTTQTWVLRSIVKSARSSSVSSVKQLIAASLEYLTRSFLQGLWATLTCLAGCVLSTQNTRWTRCARIAMVPAHALRHSLNTFVLSI